MYLNSFNPHELTINELAEIQSKPNPEKVLHHYRGELFDTFHFCTLCDRKQKVREYFKRFNSYTEADAQELQELDALLQITQDEYNENAQTVDRQRVQLFGEGF